jgi:hypothetical protein
VTVTKFVGCRIEKCQLHPGSFSSSLDLFSRFRCKFLHQSSSLSATGTLWYSRMLQLYKLARGADSRYTWVCNSSQFVSQSMPACGIDITVFYGRTTLIMANLVNCDTRHAGRPPALPVSTAYSFVLATHLPRCYATSSKYAKRAAEYSDEHHRRRLQNVANMVAVCRYRSIKCHEYVSCR